MTRATTGLKHGLSIGYSANGYRPNVQSVGIDINMIMTLIIFHFEDDKMKKKVKYSEKDTRGKLFVDCSECNRGGNGSDKDKCSSGWKVKKGRQGGCFLGVLLADLET